MDGSGDGMAMGTGMDMRIGYKWDGVSRTWGQGVGLGRGDNPVPGQGCRDSTAPCTGRGSHGYTWGPEDVSGPGGKVCLGMAGGTHACSCVVWHLHRSQAGTRHSGALPCCRGSAGTAPCAGRTPPGPSHRCYRGTGRAGSARPEQGPRSSQGHTRHSGNLLAQSAGQGPGTRQPGRHRVCRARYPPVYPGLQWQTTCWERLSW